MSEEMTKAEQRFLEAICSAWPGGSSAGIELSVNALVLGSAAGLSDVETRKAADLLAARGLVHLRVIDGVLLAHPSRVGLDYYAESRGSVGILSNLRNWAKRLVK